ncbi:MAG: sn-glycerol-3-phosphate transporter ATP-binding protein UgpC, partial [Candidatus Hydrogenedentes bacterium]|nr:sn-glycerol-3-phosphate transporter ATP-binding protein UgpC [Candidatus Hydrogenedentota bacterium]
VYKNMAFGLILRKYPKKEIEKRVHDAAQILGITELLDRKPKALSGGQRQRVAVGRAIVRQPKVFLFDEPLSNLDAKLRVQMRAEISRLHTQLQSTMIYVTHDQIEAMTMGDRIVVMLDGLIQQVASPLVLYHSPVNKFVAGFIGSPPMNMLPGVLSGENGTLRFRDDANALDLTIAPRHKDKLAGYAGKKITIGIRPEDLHDNPSQTPIPGKSLKANVDVVEPMGAEVYLYLGVGGHQVTARIKSEEEPPVNQAHVLDVDMEKVHFFDAATELTIV